MLTIKDFKRKRARRTPATPKVRDRVARWRVVYTRAADDVKQVQCGVLPLDR